MSDRQRSILHVDMDAFYVSVELRRRPDLRGRPVVVGGAGPRGVVAAASYEARRFGVFSAMASSTARRLCPHAVFLPGDHELYASVSRDVHAIFHDVTPLVEPLALDEAFLDVSGSLRLLGSAVDVGHHIRNRVERELELRCSVGVASSKFIAKLASKAAKPIADARGVRDGVGVLEVVAGRELDFLHPLPVKALWGVGPATLEKLEGLGIHTVADLAAIDEPTLMTTVGKAHGRHLHQLSWAIDDRPVEPDRVLKSIGHEETFAADLYTYEALLRELVRLSDAVAARLRAKGVGGRTLTLKLRFATFDTMSRSITLPTPVHTAHAIRKAVEPFLSAVDPAPGVRLLGVSASNFGEPSEQLSLDDLVADTERDEPTSGEWEATEQTVDQIRAKFGLGAIGPASAVTRRGLRVVRKGAQQWGPDQEPG
jgi:DNA polymerase-4